MCSKCVVDRESAWQRVMLNASRAGGKGGSEDVSPIVKFKF